jgi:hypothetical protein
VVKELIFFTISTLTERDFKRFQFEVFLKEDYRLTVCNLAFLFKYEEVFLKPFSDSVNHICLDSYDSLNCFLSKINISNTYLIPLFPINSNTIGFYKLVSNYKLNYINVKLGLTSSPYSNFKKILIRFYYFFFKLFYNLKPSKIIFYAGSIVKRNLYDFKTNFHTKFISVSSFDYLNAINTTNNKKIDQPYFVFIDEMYVNHPDFKGVDVMKMSEKKYFLQINDILNKIQIKYNLKPVVCLHPRSDKSWASNFDFKTVKNQTNELIKYSNFVITHASTAISYAVLFYKPIIHIKMNIQSKYYLNVLENYNKDLETNILHYKNNFDSKNLKLDFNKERYNNYIKAYFNDNSNSKLYSKELIKILKPNNKCVE